MRKEQCEPVSNPFARSMCNDPRSQSSPCLSNSGTETARSYGGEEHNQPIKFLWADSANSVLSFITFYETMLADYKAHRRPPRPPPRRKAGGVSSPLSGGRNRKRASNPESGRGSDGKRKKIRTHPSSFLHLIHLRFPRAQPALRLVFRETGRHREECRWRLFTQRTPPRASTQCLFFNFLFFYTGSQLPRELTPLALLSSRQHTDCVYPQQRKLFICREEHTACNAICSRQVLVLLCTYSYRGAYPECLWNTASRNKLQQRSTVHTRSSGCWMTKADAGSTARAFILPGRLRHPPVTSRPSVGQITHVFRARSRCWRSPRVFGRSSSSWRGTVVNMF